MNNVLLISESHIKKQSVLENNVDGKLLNKVILNVQEIQLQPILGADLYKSVLDAVAANVSDNTAIPDETKELLNDYIIPFLTYGVLCDFIVVNNYKISNKGMMRVNDNSAQSVSSTELEYAKNYYDNYLASYKNRLIQYLKSKEKLDTKADTDVTSYSIGWYLEQP